MEGVSRRLGVEPDVIAGEEEARLSFTGAVSALEDEPLAPEELILVVDLGGGSTEFVVGTADGTVVDAVSMDMGCVRFTERFLRSDPPTAEETAAAREAVGALLDDVAARLPLDRVARVVGVAGSVTTLTAEALGLEAYDSAAIHGTRLPLERIRAAADALLHATREERAARGFMHPGRVDVIGAGALIWTTLLERVAAVSGVTEAVTSEHDILDGIVLALRG